MAEITRQTLTQMRDEVVDRLGFSGETAVEGRVSYWLAQAYRQVALTVYHHELVEIDFTLTASIGSRTFTLPTDTWSVISITLRAAADDAYVAVLANENLKTVFQGLGDDSDAQPTSYARVDRTIYFDKTSDAAYKIELLHYIDVDPDIAAGTSLLHAMWDEPVMQLALSKAARHLGQTAKADAAMQDFTAFLEMQGQPLIKGLPVADIPTMPLTNVRQGGTV